jgi:hypothetical protein
MGPVADGVAIHDSEFAIDPPGFEKRGMKVRLSYWAAPKVYLDGNLLQPVSSGFLGRNRVYTAVSTFGKTVAIRLTTKPLDQVPDVEIGGERFLLARPLNRWEYIWIALPVLVIALGGGAIGGAIAMAAVYSNSILMRRIGHWFPRYLLTGATTAMAFILFINIASAIGPVLQSLFSPVRGDTIEQQLITTAKEFNRRCPFLVDEETRADSISAGPGSELTYHFTLIKRSITELDLNKLRESIRPNILANIRTNMEMKQLKDLNVSFVYAYVDKGGRAAVEITVTPQDYHQ